MSSQLKPHVEELILSIDPTWQKVLHQEFAKPYFTKLADFLVEEREKGDIYPPQELVFNALAKTPYSKVKVVIIGQDPYHGERQAHGLSFSVPPGIRHPPSLRNIFKELHTDLQVPIPTQGSLDHWAEQGVLLLNATLTVSPGKPLSHAGRGWEELTDAIVKALGEREKPVIFVLWGKFAQQKCAMLQALPGSDRHFYLLAAHPSPFSAHQGFFGCRHFSKINQLLTERGELPIQW